MRDASSGDHMVSRTERLGQIVLERYSDVPLFNAKAVAQQTGVPAPTLRAWERRYGVLTPQRGPNDYRLYSERDIAIARWLRARVENGLTISQAIALLRSNMVPHLGPEHHLKEPQPASRAAAAHQQASAESIPREQRNDAAGAAQTPAVPASQLAALADELLEACVRLDERVALRVLASMFAIFSVEQAIADVLQPLLQTIGERWQTGQLSITVEHFTTALIRRQLESIYHAQAVPPSGPLVLVGCAPGEQHELGVLILALLLRRRCPDLRVIYLGQNVEPLHLLETIQAQRPAVVCLSAAMPERLPALAALARHISTLPLHPAPVLVYGGRAFAQAAEEIEGVFLGTDPLQAVAPIERLCRQRLSFPG
jgi:DNA-binding transcriptional MerR regulator